MIYCTGDTHSDVTRLNMACFPEQMDMTRDDYVIIAGDFGLVWDMGREENYWLDWLEKKPFTTLFVDGNHENFDLLSTYPEVDYHGGKAHQIRDHIFHLMRGYVFEIGGKTIFAFGGAASHDISDGILDPADYADDPKRFARVRRQLQRRGAFFRVKGQSWWPQEMPDETEMERGRASLKKAGYKVDFVITHCAPQDVAALAGGYKRDRLTMYFSDLVQEGLQFDRWLFGHYHDNRQLLGKYILIYEQIIRIA